MNTGKTIVCRTLKADGKLKNELDFYLIAVNWLCDHKVPKFPENFLHLSVSIHSVGHMAPFLQGIFFSFPVILLGVAELTEFGGDEAVWGHRRNLGTGWQTGVARQSSLFSEDELCVRFRADTIITEMIQN